jgi:hypothetical protein
LFIFLPAPNTQSLIGNFDQPNHEPPRIQSHEGAYFILGMRNLSRRELLAELARAGLLTTAGAFAAPSLFARAIQSATTQEQESIALARPRYRVSADDDGLLDEISRCAVRFFWEQASPVTGLIKDRARADGSDTRDLASVAATGFGLSALAIADQRAYIDSDKILERVRTSLRYIANRLPTVHGFYYHFVNMNNGVRALKCEVSSIDSALLLCGVLTCRGHFDDDEIQSLSKRICDRVDWRWMLNGDFTLSHGWRPEGGFLKSRWDTYCELMMMYLLGLGSPTHAIPPECWDAWYRPKFEYEQLHYIGAFAPIFVHQYSHAWFDFHGKEDSYTDYFANSVIATEAHRLFCLSLKDQFPYFSETLWGISASDSTKGYRVWGGPPQMGQIDGTVVPCATAGSLPFLPEHTMRVLWTMRQQYDEKGWRRYGFVDSFNPGTDWYDDDVIAINAGISLLMAENLRSGFIWNAFMKNEEVKKGMDQAGFVSAIPFPSNQPLPQQISKKS